MPHSGAMVLIDRVLSYNEESIVSELDVSPRLPFITGNRAPAFLVIEIMAQSIAAWSGIRRNTPGDIQPVGYLLGTRKFQSSQDYFELGSTLTVSAEQVLEYNGLAQFKCVLDVLFEGVLSLGVAEAKISVYSKPDT